MGRDPTKIEWRFGDDFIDATSFGGMSRTWVSGTAHSSGWFTSEAGETWTDAGWTKVYPDGDGYKMYYFRDKTAETIIDVFARELAADNTE